MPRNVLANRDAVVTLADGTTRTIKRNTGYPSSDPIVAEFSWAFDLEDEDEKPRRGRRPRIEQATAAPGEHRDL